MKLIDLLYIVDINTTLHVKLENAFNYQELIIDDVKYFTDMPIDQQRKLETLWAVIEKIKVIKKNVLEVIIL